MRQVDLPRGPERERVRGRDRVYTLRGSESRTLATVGAFRVVASSDLRVVHSRPLYHAIGEPFSRYRRPVSPRLALERVMRLDAILSTPADQWLTTPVEKAAALP